MIDMNLQELNKLYLRYMRAVADGRREEAEELLVAMRQVRVGSLSRRVSRLASMFAALSDS